ncbi:MAG TPA: ABC transporter ATP-binding protein [Candidatus Stackebrandtia excrementipullorum]|nr:ABC transporter ATP-binding protein [Candidatus Stackebrandtia excrementipullorum]
MTVARAVNLTHRYGEQLALDRVNLDVERGQLVGLLGPNGAGKSTLLKLFTGGRFPTDGSVELFGFDPRRPTARRHIGVTPQETGLPETLRVGEVVDYVRAHFPEPADRDDLLDRFGLLGMRRKQTGALSGGQKRRLAVALAFVGRPKLVFLDEPTTGLDVEARRSLWDAIASFHAEGGTVVLTSHYLEEVEALAQRVVVIGEGRLLADGHVDEIKKRVGLTKVSYLGEQIKTESVVDSRRDRDRVVVYTSDPDQVIRELVTAGPDFRELAIEPASLEDAFLTLTNA